MRPFFPGVPFPMTNSCFGLGFVEGICGRGGGWGAWVWFGVGVGVLFARPSAFSFLIGGVGSSREILVSGSLEKISRVPGVVAPSLPCPLSRKIKKMDGNRGRYNHA